MQIIMFFLLSKKYTPDNLPKSRRTDWDKMEYEDLMWDNALNLLLRFYSDMMK